MAKIDYRSEEKIPGGGPFVSTHSAWWGKSTDIVFRIEDKFLPIAPQVVNWIQEKMKE